MANKTKSTLFNMVLALFLVSLVASTSLAYVYELTKAPIAAAKLKKKTEAIKKVMPQFDNSPIEDMFKMNMQKGDSLECYPAKSRDKMVGIAIKSYTKKGFTGKFWLMVGFTMDGKINNISVLEHKETPGLGDKMEKKKADWSKQYNGKHPKNNNLKVSKDGGEIDAITAATISSRAYTDDVLRAYKAFEKAKKGQ